MFFFPSRRRHTRFDCDWSSDVCSSDLNAGIGTSGMLLDLLIAHQREHAARADAGIVDEPVKRAELLAQAAGEIGRASCRERVEISVVAVSLKKKKFNIQPEFHLRLCHC